MNPRLFLLRGLFAASVLLLAGGVRAQWVTEKYPLKAGWNSIWLSPDCSYAPIGEILSGQPRILQVWRWNPLGSSRQYTSTPANPIRPDAEWTVWIQGDTTGSKLDRLVGNAGYLVYVAAGADLTLQLTGRPLLPRFNGKSSGMALTGYPISPLATTTQGRFDRFFSFDPVLKGKPRVFRYVGGEFSSVEPKNPSEIVQQTSTSVERNVAYWVEPASYTTYYGPIEVTVVAGDGLDYAKNGVSRTIRVKNVTDPARNLTVDVTFTPAASAVPPSGQPANAGAVPLLLDAGIDEATLTRTYAPFAGPVTRSIPPGGEVDVDFILNRGAMGTVAGKVFQSLVQVTDSLGLTRVDVPVSATSTSLAGLWVGEASVNAVEQILGNPEGTPSPAATPTPVAAPFKMRLIVHIDAAGQATLLQQAYGAVDGGTAYAIYTPARYKAALATAKSPFRISSAAFPLDMAVDGDRAAAPGAVVKFAVPLLYDAASNPFVHTYHPAHDNFDATFLNVLKPPLAESYEVNRAVQFAFDSEGGGLPTWGSSLLTGNYSETITGLRVAPIRVSGAFSLTRVADAPTILK